MREITKGELQDILESHKKWLNDEDDGERADLRYADLGFANLSRANLSRADLRYAGLSNADLSCANLRGADLRYADLGFANLRGANLIDTDLRCADLMDTNLSYAKTNKRYIQVSCIGSRKATTTYCVDDNLVLCGCWNNYSGGTLGEFEKRVKEIYGENGEEPNKQHYDEYIGAINFFKGVAGK